MTIANSVPSRGGNSGLGKPSRVVQSNFHTLYEPALDFGCVDVDSEIKALVGRKALRPYVALNGFESRHAVSCSRSYVHPTRNRKEFEELRPQQRRDFGRD